MKLLSVVYYFLPILGMNATSRPITKNVAIRPNKSTCSDVQPVVFAALIDVIPTPAIEPTTTSAITAMTTVFMLTNIPPPI
jgi:hypothetical protein